MSQPASALMLEAALDYAARGEPVFPVQPHGKAPLTAHGLHDATTDPDTITRWWLAHPRANIGLRTGAPGVDVLDVDVRADGSGWEAFHAARQAGLLRGWTRAVRTPSGGLHLHYPGSDQRNGSLRGRHLDFRGQGGYVLMPPSRVVTPTYAAEYTVAAEQPGPGLRLDWAAVQRLLAPPPERIGSPLNPSRADAIGWLTAFVGRQREGNRDNGLFWAACRAAESGHDPRPLIDAAVAVGLPEQQARRTVRSACDTVNRLGATPSLATASEPMGLRR